MSSLFDFINSASDHSRYMADDEDFEAVYDTFVANRSMSLHPDAVLYANMMNSFLSQISKKQNYDFYYYGLRGKKRYSKWPKKPKDDYIPLIMQNYGYNEAKAKAAAKLLTLDQLEEIKDRLNNKGGISG